MLTPYDPKRGAAILEAAMGEWRSNVQEPPHGNPEPIRRYLAACGFSGAQAYHADGDAEWCGAFAAFCLIQAGANPSILRQQDPESGGLGSTYRAMRLVGHNPARRIADVRDVRPGDVVIVGRTGRRAWGEHVVIAAREIQIAGHFATVEGNAFGETGEGLRAEGVVRRTRMGTPTATAKGFIFGVRLTPGDYLREV